MSNIDDILKLIGTSKVGSKKVLVYSEQHIDTDFNDWSNSTIHKESYKEHCSVDLPGFEGKATLKIENEDESVETFGEPVYFRSCAYSKCKGDCEYCYKLWNTIKHLR